MVLRLIHPTFFNEIVLTYNKPQIVRVISGGLQFLLTSRLAIVTRGMTKQTAVVQFYCSSGSPTSQISTRNGLSRTSALYSNVLIVISYEDQNLFKNILAQVIYVCDSYLEMVSCPNHKFTPRGSQYLTRKDAPRCRFC